MTNMEIINQNLPLIQTCVECQFAQVKDKQFRSDFLADLIIILNDYDNQRLNKINDEGKMNCFLTGIITRNIHSKTSPYYRDYYRFQDKTDEIGEKEMELDNDSF